MGQTSAWIVQSEKNIPFTCHGHARQLSNAHGAGGMSYYDRREAVDVNITERPGNLPEVEFLQPASKGQKHGLMSKALVASALLFPPFALYKQLSR